MNVTNRKKKTALHQASAIGDPEFVQLLLSHRVRPEINAIDHNGKTPLHWAAKGVIRSAGISARTQTVRLLLNAGANKKLKDNEGNTAYDYAPLRALGMRRLLATN